MNYAGMTRAPGQFGIGGSRIAPRPKPQTTVSDFGGPGTPAGTVQGIGGSYTAARVPTASANAGVSSSAGDGTGPSRFPSPFQNPDRNGGVVAGVQQAPYQAGTSQQDMQEEMLRRQLAAQMANQNPDNSALSGYMFG